MSSAYRHNLRSFTATAHFRFSDSKWNWMESDFLWLDDTDKRFEESLFDLYFCKQSSVLFPYNKQWKIISLTTILQTFLFTFAAILSQILPDPHLHSFHPACTHLITSFVDFVLFSMIESGYLNLSTCTTSPLCILTLQLSPSHSCLASTNFHSDSHQTSISVGFRLLL